MKYANGLLVAVGNSDPKIISARRYNMEEAFINITNLQDSTTGSGTILFIHKEFGYAPIVQITQLLHPNQETFGLPY